MSTRTADAGEDPPITSRDDLIALFSGGEKPPERWRIGTEHEKFVYFTDSHRAPSYEEKGGIHALLIGLTKYGWEPIYEGENIIAPFRATARRSSAGASPRCSPSAA